MYPELAPPIRVSFPPTRMVAVRLAKLETGPRRDRRPTRGTWIAPRGMGVDVLQTLWFFLPAYVGNMAPVLMGDSFESLARPIDGGCSLGGVRILGDHKTWRGLLAGVVAGALTGLLQQLLYAAGVGRALAAVDYSAGAVALGALMGLGAGVGDAVKSFFKRRVGIAPGASWIGFDQLDFLAGAWAFAAPVHVPSPLVMLVISPIVFAGSIAVTAAGYWMHLKEAWL
jgi:CDP-2,3-bis-(O-geranylgeranyl)-sn-glycerol synthase